VGWKKAHIDMMHKLKWVVKYIKKQKTETEISLSSHQANSKTKDIL